MKSKIKVSELAREVFDDLESYGGKVFLVGGRVRDQIFKVPSKDNDVEVFHLTYEALCQILSRYGEVKTFGASFAVVQLSTLPDYEFALPRREYKTGAKHTDFRVDIEKDLPIEKAVLRRDFTINAMMYDYANEAIIDSVGGFEDCLSHTLRYVDGDHFGEDPLRILRAASLIARFDLKVEEKTKALITKMVADHQLDDLSIERVSCEYTKILMAPRPSLGLTFLKEIGALPDYLEELVHCDQRRDYHPEGSVWNHTMLVVDMAALIKDRTSDPEAFMWSALLHDIGKPAVTTPEGHAYRHNESGVEAFKKVSLVTGKKQRLYVETMIMYHMNLMNMARNHSRPIKYLRLLKAIENKVPLNDLVWISKCDKLGRGMMNGDQVAFFDLYINEMKDLYGDKAPEAIVSGKDLLEAGLTNTKEFSDLLENCYEWQLEGLKKEQILRRVVNESRQNSD